MNRRNSRWWGLIGLVVLALAVISYLFYRKSKKGRPLAP